MPSELQERIQAFRAEYLETPAGQKHLADVEAEPREVTRVVAEIRQKHAAGQDITDDVLRRLLPHTDSEFHRHNDYRVSTWPCVRKDIRSWFEGAGWKQPDDWPETSRLLFEAVDGLASGREEAWNRFLTSEYRHGFGTGFISPILFCLDEGFPVVTSQVVKTYAYCTRQLGDADEIDAKLDHYLVNAGKVLALQKTLEPLGLRSIREWDMFCHYVVSKRLGGGIPTDEVPPEFAAWLFVANPDVFRWEQAFEDDGVDWTSSLGAYPQKLLRGSIGAGDRVLGYQTRPHYEVSIEMRVTSRPRKTQEGTWAVRLEPVRRFEKPIALSVLKADPVLSAMEFVRQPQLSISGITQEQLELLDTLISEGAVGDNASGLASVDKLCQDLMYAQFDTSQPTAYEALLAEAFRLLGFEAEHIGGSGQPDVLVVGRMGSDSYAAVIEAKTCQRGSAVGAAQVNYGSMADHREEHTADHALLVAPAFAGGKLVDHAVKNNVGMVSTEDIVSVLRQHDQFPFSIAELRRLFEAKGPGRDVIEELGRIHAQHYDQVQLVGTVLRIFDRLQRQQDASEPISSSAIYFLLLNQSHVENVPTPDRKQIDAVLSLLANPVLAVLRHEEAGYVLSISADAARQRVLALAGLLWSEE